MRELPAKCCRSGCLFFVLLGGAALGGLAVVYPGVAHARNSAPAERPQQPPPMSDELLEKAKEVYSLQCAACHGATGGGDGDAAYLLFPKPRNFRAAYFRLTSTHNRVPTDADLFRTITRGIPASSMSGWAHLPEEVRLGLVHLIRGLWREGLVESFVEEEDLDQDEANEIALELTTPGEPIAVPTETADSLESRAAGRELYVERCLSCHGEEGRGDGTEQQKTVEGYPIRPADYTQGLFKGGSDSDQLYYRISKGMSGTPMPESQLSSTQIWDLAHYIRSLAKPGAEEKALQGRTTIVANKLRGTIADDPFDPVWSRTAPRFIALRPLWWRDRRIDGVVVRALHNGSDLAVQLSWEDASMDADALESTQFGDAAALQFSLDADPPFFGMGSADKPVNIWHWKALWEQDALARRDLEQIYPASGEVSSMFLTGKGSGNPLSALGHPTPIEDLNSRAFGTLSSQPKASQDVTGKGIWKKGIWRVVFRRPFETGGRWDARFSSASTVRIAIAVWDGAAGDRDGQKSFSSWHDLELAD